MAVFMPLCSGDVDVVGVQMPGGVRGLGVPLPSGSSLPLGILGWVGGSIHWLPQTPACPTIGHSRGCSGGAGGTSRPSRDGAA